MSVGFSQLEVGGYRRLRQVELRLAPLNVLIGANGVGKSSILEVVDLLAASADGDLENTISEAGGISSLLTLDGRTNALRFSLQMPITDAQPINYDLTISREGVGYGIGREQLTQHQDVARPNPFKFIDSRGAHVLYHDPAEKNLIRPNWDYKATETALSQVPKMYQTPERFRQLLASSSALYHTLDVSFRAPVRSILLRSAYGRNHYSLLTLRVAMERTFSHACIRCGKQSEIATRLWKTRCGLPFPHSSA